jgi:hypothetical protein
MGAYVWVFWTTMLGLVGLVGATNKNSHTAPSTTTTTTTLPQGPQRRGARTLVENKAGSDAWILSLDFSLWFPTSTSTSTSTTTTTTTEPETQTLSADGRNSNNNLLQDNDNEQDNAWFVSSGIVTGVLEALLELLCTDTDMHVMDAAYQDVCVLHEYDSRRRRRQRKKRHRSRSRSRSRSRGLQAVSPSSSSSSSSSTISRTVRPTILKEDPAVTIRRQDLILDLPLPQQQQQQQQKDYYYHQWTVQYTTFQIGDTFLQNENTDTAIQSMQQTIQLALDLSIMEGDFDGLLAKHVSPGSNTPLASGTTATATTTTTTTNSALKTAVYSSPTGREAVFFGRLAAAMASSLTPETYETAIWNPMRTIGLALLGTVLLLCTTLGLLADRRRVRTNRTTVNIFDKNDDDDAVTFMLQSPEGVDSLLNRSASSFPMGKMRLFRDNHDGNDNDNADNHDMADNDSQDDDEDAEETRIPLPIALQ